MDDEFFAWEDLKRWRDPKRRRGHNAETARKSYDRGAVCPACNRGGDDLTWFYYGTPSWTWKNLCGRAGWMVVCDECHKQIDFVLEEMN